MLVVNWRSTLEPGAALGVAVDAVEEEARHPREAAVEGGQGVAEAVDREGLTAEPQHVVEDAQTDRARRGVGRHDDVDHVVGPSQRHHAGGRRSLEDDPPCRAEPLTADREQLTRAGVGVVERPDRVAGQRLLDPRHLHHRADQAALVLGRRLVDRCAEVGHKVGHHRADADAGDALALPGNLRPAGLPARPELARQAATWLAAARQAAGGHREIAGRQAHERAHRLRVVGPGGSDEGFHEGARPSGPREAAHEQVGLGIGGRDVDGSRNDGQEAAVVHDALGRAGRRFRCVLEHVAEVVDGLVVGHRRDIAEEREPQAIGGVGLSA